MSCLARCCAKSFMFFFSLLIFLVGILLLGVGVFAATRLKDYIPVGPVAYVLIAIGCVVFVLGITGFTTLCCPGRRKCSLGVMMVLTILAFALSGAATGLGFYYEDIMATAFKNGFGDEADNAKHGLNELQSTFYNGLRGSFKDLYEGCDPTAYYSSEVHTSCETFDDDDEAKVEECASDEYPTGFVGLYCKEGPGLDPFSIDRAMAFPDKEKSLSIQDFIEKRSFGYFANYACMPTVQRYLEMQLEIDGLPPQTTFGSCYASKWWGDKDAPVPGGEFTQQPDGDDLTIKQQEFFGSLSNTSKFMSDKMVFCFCSDEGEDSKLYSFLQTASSYSKWISLGATIFFLLVFISECYLCCCAKSEAQPGDTYKTQLTVLRP